jgi:hypothetical protein
MTLNWFQLSWLHEISQAALAGAVVTLGLVILLELRSIKLLRRLVDNSMGRVFEQLDLMRLDQHPGDTDSAQPSVVVRAAMPASAASAPAAAAPAAGNAYAAAAALASTGMRPEEIAQRCGLGAGEARLLASLAAARVSRRTDV